MSRPPSRHHLLRAVCLSAVFAGAAWCAIVPLKATASGPDEFYAPLFSRLGGAFRDELHELIDDRAAVSMERTVEVLRVADRVAMTPSLVLDLYSDQTFAAGPVAGKDREWDRGHAWPDSRGFDDAISRSLCNVPLTDVHMLFVADPHVNRGDQSNRRYDDCPDDEAPVGGLGADLSHSCQDAFEVWSKRRGDVARAMFYADVRYDGGANDARPPSGDGGVRDERGHCREPDLVLTNSIPDIESTSASGTITGTAYMGVLRALLEWHFADPVDALDHQHNEAVATTQTNRNPFIDHPDWVCKVWPDETPCQVRRFAFLPILQRSN